MLAILLLASYIRIHDLNAQGMWGDEGWSMWLARGDSVRDLTMTMVADHHGPVYSMLLRAWDALAGNTVLALRAITVLFSIASIALIYRLGRALFSPAAGVGAALAFTLMDKQVVLTQEVRDYPMVFFTMIGIAYLYVRWRQDRSRGTAFGFVALSVFGLYLHYYCYMVNLAILLHAALTLRDRAAGRHFVALNALVALAFVPWTFVVVHQFVNTPVDSEVLTIHGLPFDRYTLEYLATESFGRPVALFGLLALVGAVGPLWRTPGPMHDAPRRTRTPAALLPVLWFGVPVILTAALHSRYPLLTDRNIAVIMPAIALLVGYGLTAFERFGALFLAALITVNGVFTTGAFFDKPPWREMAADIAADYPGGAEVVLLDVEGAHAALWYHTLLALPGADIDATMTRLPAEDTAPAVISLYDYRQRYQGDFIPQVQRALDGVPGLWLAYWGDAAKKRDMFDLLAAEGFVRTAERAYDHHGNPIYAYRYDRRAALAREVGTFQLDDSPQSDRIILHKAAWYDPAPRGEDLHVLLWWGVEQTPESDYTVSVFLLDEDEIPLFGPAGLLVQHDGVPAGGAAPTSGWVPGEFVFVSHPLALPQSLSPGTYTIGVKLYRLLPDGSTAVLPAVDGAEWQVVGTLTVN